MPTLERYRRPCILVLNPSASAREAARAMAARGVDTAIVCEGGVIVGILTERDLSREILSADLDPHATRLRDIMSCEVATLDVGADLAQAAQLMRRRACRRIPITEDGCLVGLVTLDDLLADGEFGQPTRLAVAAQLDAAEDERPRRSRRFATRILEMLGRTDSDPPSDAEPARGPVLPRWQTA